MARATGSMRLGGMTLPGKGWPVRGSRTAVVKIPWRLARVGRVGDARDAARDARPLVVGEEERLVLDDGSAEVGAELVLVVRELGEGLKAALGAEVLVEVGVRVELLVAVVVVGRAVERVGARLRGHGDGRPRGAPVLRGVGARDDLELLDRVDRGTRHLGATAPGRSSRSCCCRRRRAGSCSGASGSRGRSRLRCVRGRWPRPPRCSGRPGRRPRARACRPSCGSRAAAWTPRSGRGRSPPRPGSVLSRTVASDDGHALGERSHGEREVEPRPVARLQDERLGLVLEAGRLRGDDVPPGTQVDDEVLALAVGRRPGRDVGGGMGDGDRPPDDRGAGRVAELAAQRGAIDLGAGRGGEAEHERTGGKNSLHRVLLPASWDPQLPSLASTLARPPCEIFATFQER